MAEELTPDERAWFDLMDEQAMRFVHNGPPGIGRIVDRPTPEEIREELGPSPGDIVLTVVSLMALIGVVVWVVAEAFR